jgi:hypothetical protein
MSKKQQSNRENKKPKAAAGTKSQPSAYKASQGVVTPASTPFLPKKK